MIFTLVLVLIGVLLFLVIGINVIQQQKERAEAERRVELARQRAIIDETEEILSQSSMFPCSSQIILVLYKRVRDALKIAKGMAGTQVADYERRLNDISGQVTNISNGTQNTPPIEGFRLPDNDKQVLALVQVLKKLKAILRSEHNKGKVSMGIFSEEEGRIDSLQLRINVESMLSRAKMSCATKQYGTAKQMVTKALSTLQAIKAQTPNDPFIGRKVDEAKALLEEISGAQKESAPVVQQDKEEKDIDVLFQQKKKW
ncbi:hypothetical protein HQQ94_09790 [Shewanella sp. VB17]|uniref:hypothetical protein n=1 Tax=Shewanella sp. VB17 TaxID=2739432 RepID=UPI001566CC02|nr:hypothetical protein [Shewanella sp. VB17]NRD73532.1 hypothetical protein [Shewanella sp. VB17]